MRKKTIASRYCRFASKYCRIAGVAPAGSEDTGGEAIRGSVAEGSITLGFHGTSGQAEGGASSVTSQNGVRESPFDVARGGPEALERSGFGIGLGPRRGS